ncbi:MAG: hypothetical protein NC928_04060 [Candidatus Omnitrophica bacterium]|nr:hypothetical protein [Candidatus Omnitrophota bacterium]
MKSNKLCRFQKQIIKIIIFSVCCFILASLIGCEAFVRKFTRKPKKESLPREEMVLVPEEYKPTQDKEQLYRQYFVFWRSWHDELLNSLIPHTNHKKQIDCAQEAIKNLMHLRQLLNLEKQKKLDIYINRLSELKEMIAQDIYGSNYARHRQIAERLRMDILRDFSYPKINKDII